jgi:membrane protein required for beta-lactamase induction
MAEDARAITGAMRILLMLPWKPVHLCGVRMGLPGVEKPLDRFPF